MVYWLVMVRRKQVSVCHRLNRTHYRWATGTLRRRTTLPEGMYMGKLWAMGIWVYGYMLVLGLIDALTMLQLLP